MCKDSVWCVAFETDPWWRRAVCQWSREGRCCKGEDHYSPLHPGPEQHQCSPDTWTNTELSSTFKCLYISDTFSYWYYNIYDYLLIWMTGLIFYSTWFRTLICQIFILLVILSIDNFLSVWQKIIVLMVYRNPAWGTYLKSICLSMRLAVATRGSLPVERECSSRLEEMIWVVISVSAAVPAPQQLDNNTSTQQPISYTSSQLHHINVEKMLTLLKLLYVGFEHSKTACATY